MLSFQDVITPKGSRVILDLKSSNANRSVSLFPPTKEVTNKPHHKRRIKVCLQEEECGGAEYQWRSPIYNNNMVEEAVGTSVKCVMERRAYLAVFYLKKVANL